MTARIYVRRSLTDFPTPTPQPTPCRLWQGPLQEGYGQRFSRTGHRRMHRWVMSVVLGRPLARNEVIMHLCDLCGRVRSAWDSQCTCPAYVPCHEARTPIEKLHVRLTQSEWIVCAEALRILNDEAVIDCVELA